MSDIDNFPEEWKTNRNLRWWLIHQPPLDIILMPDDKFIHESVAVDFAKQFHAEEIAQLHAKLKRYEEVLRFYANHENYINIPETASFIAIENDGEYVDPMPPFRMTKFVAGKRARQALEEER